MTPVTNYRTALRQAILNIGFKWAQGVDKQGHAYAWVVDPREVILQQDYLHYAARLLWDQLKPYRPDMVAGMTVAASALAVAIMYESRADGQPVDAILIRKEPKADGLRKQLEGPTPPAGARIVLVDDLIHGGEAQRQALAALKVAGADIVAIGSILDYQRAGSKALRADGYPLEVLFTFADLGMAVLDPPDDTLLSPRWAWSGLHQGSPPTIAGGRIVIASDRGFVVALNLEGEELWRHPLRDQTRGSASRPLVIDGRVYVGAYDGYVYCIELSHGQPSWESHVGDHVASSIGRAPGLIYVSFARGEGGGLAALDAHSGQRLWEVPLSAPSLCTPCRYNSTVLCSSEDGLLQAFDAETGAPLWSTALDGGVHGDVAVDTDGTCFAGTWGGTLYALSTDSGSICWQKKLGAHLETSPIVAGALVVVTASSARAVALDKSNGDVRWLASTHGRIAGGAARLPSGDYVVTSTDGCVYVFRHTDGKTLWRYRTNGPISRAAGTGEGLVAVASGDGRVYLFGIS